MMATMDYCYDKLRTNSNEAEEITNWIKDVRVQLKKNVIRKHNREINNKEIYSYMHDIFGRDVINLFDVKYEEEQKAKASEETITVAPTLAPSPKKEKVQPTENFDA